MELAISTFSLDLPIVSAGLTTPNVFLPVCTEEVDSLLAMHLAPMLPHPPFLCFYFLLFLNFYSTFLSSLVYDTTYMLDARIFFPKYCDSHV